MLQTPFSVMGISYTLRTRLPDDHKQTWVGEVVDGSGQVVYGLTIDMDTIADAASSGIPHLFTTQALEKQVQDSFTRFVTEVVPLLAERTEADKRGARRPD